MTWINVETGSVFIPAGTPLNLTNKTFSPDIVSKISELDPNISIRISNVRNITAALMWKSGIFLEDFDMPREDSNAEPFAVLWSNPESEYSKGVYLEYDKTSNVVTKYVLSHWGSVKNPLWEIEL